MILSVAFLASCSSSIPVLESPVLKERTFPYSFSRVWKRLIPAIVKMGGSIRTLDKESGIVVFVKTLSSSEAKCFGVYARGSRVLRKKVKGGSMEVNLIVEPVGRSRVRIRVLSRMSVVISSIGGSTRVLVPSSGEFEKRFFYIVDRIMGGGNYSYLFR